MGWITQPYLEKGLAEGKAQGIACGTVPGSVPNTDLGFVANGLELRVFELLDEEDPSTLVGAARDAFQVARTLPVPNEPIQAAEWLLRIGCIGILGDRGADVRRILIDRDPLADLPFETEDWGVRVWAYLLAIWLRLLRKRGSEDLDAVQDHVAALRVMQREWEPGFLQAAEARKDTRPAWELMSDYHLAKAAELLGRYLSQRSVHGRYDIGQQLEAQFDRAVVTAARGQFMERELLARLLSRTSRTLIENCIWTVT